MQKNTRRTKQLDQDDAGPETHDNEGVQETLVSIAVGIKGQIIGLTSKGSLRTYDVDKKEWKDL
jgi:hypothetical protein